MSSGVFMLVIIITTGCGFFLGTLWGRGDP